MNNCIMTIWFQYSQACKQCLTMFGIEQTILFVELWFESLKAIVSAENVYSDNS